MIDLENAAKLLNTFCDGSLLTGHISRIEQSLVGANKESAQDFLHSQSINEPILDAALLLKSFAGQINVVVHTLGVILSLPHILEPDETISYVSLGAGTGGKEFDLETDRRVAEFKFINWQGRSEAIRQNQLFKDLFYLAEYNGGKRRQLCVLGCDYPHKFLRGRRALNSVLSRNNRLRADLYSRYPDRYKVVSEYYSDVKHLVEIVDLTQRVPAFRSKKVPIQEPVDNDL